MSATVLLDRCLTGSLLPGRAVRSATLNQWLTAIPLLDRCLTGNKRRGDSTAHVEPSARPSRFRPPHPRSHEAEETPSGTKRALSSNPKDLCRDLGTLSRHLRSLDKPEINRETLDEQDGGIGKVGYEINFNRVFFQYQPPRPLHEIDAELAGVEQWILELLREVTE